MTRTSHAPVLPVLDGVVVTAAGVEAFDCPVCGCARDLVVPSCDDGPDHDECPDRACAACGLALVVGSTFREPALGRPASRKIEPRRAG